MLAAMSVEANGGYAYHHFTNAPAQLCHIQNAYAKWPIVLKARGGPFLSVVLPKKVDETFTSESKKKPHEHMSPTKTIIWAETTKIAIPQ